MYPVVGGRVINNSSKGIKYRIKPLTIINGDMKMQLFEIGRTTNFVYSVLTITMTPSTLKVSVLGLSSGEYRKNSCSSLYHFTEYKLVPSKSYWHFNVTELLKFAHRGTSNFNNFNVSLLPEKSNDIELIMKI